MDKKIKRLVIIIICIIIIGVLVFMKNRFSVYGKIVEGISYETAINHVETSDDYYIVRASGYNTGSEFIMDYGINKNADVELTGKGPYQFLGQIFQFDNCFLVKGKEVNIHNLNKKFDEALPNIYSIEVEEWKIITPIKRDYTYSNHSRWRYSKKFIDQYDINMGDYNP